MAERKKRSRGYPGITLADSISNLRVIQQGMGLGAHDREAIAKALGHEAETGASNRKIGALNMFGLIDRGANGYAITNLGKSLLRPLPGEEPDLLRKAFLNVPLYAEVFEKYKPEGRLPQHISALLERYFGILPPSGDYAARAMIQSGKYAGLLDDDLEFIDAEPKTASNFGTVEVCAPNVEAQVERHPREAATKPSDRATVMLSNPAIELSAPASMTSKQKDRVVAWLDKVVKPWLEFQIEESEETEEEPS